MSLNDAQINAIYEAVLQQPASTAEQAAWVARDAQVGDAEVISEIVNSAQTQTEVWPIIRLLELTSGLYPSAVAISAAVNEQKDDGGTLSFKEIIDQQIESAAFKAFYGFNPASGDTKLAETPRDIDFIKQVYEFAAGYVPTHHEIVDIIHEDKTFSKLIEEVTNDSPKYVASEDTLLVENLTLAADNAAGIGNTLQGQNFNLTTGLDTINITTANTADTVNGIIDLPTGGNPNNSTYTVGDNITGNNHTTLKVAIEGSADGTAALVTMAGVSTVDFVKGADLDVSVPAVKWGSVNNINASGEGGDIEIHGLNVTNGNGLRLAISSTTTGYLTVSKSAHLSGLNLYDEVKSEKGALSVASVSLAGVNASIGKSGYFDLTLSQTAEHTASKGDATVGNISIGSISVKLATNASVDDVKISNYASAASHNATVGNVAVGNVNFTMAQSADADFYVYNEAVVSTGKGNATAGNLTIGNITVNETGKTGDFYGSAYNEAYANTGNASVGNLTIGNISLHAKDYVDFSATQYAEVYDAGNATVGNIKVGNISLTGGTQDDQSVELHNSAYVEGKGVALAGNISVGTVNVTNNYYGEVIIEQKAYVSDTGTATAGNITVGNVTLSNKGSDYGNQLYVKNYATVDSSQGGVATVGNVTIGTVAITVAQADVTYSGYVEVYNEAHNYGSKAHNATAGGVSIGNITIADVIGLTKSGANISGGHAEVYVYQSADAEHGNATVGNVSLGNISINAGAVTVQTNASNIVEVYNEVYASHGVATAGTITIGNVTANTGVKGVVDLTVENFADGASTADKTGLVTVGNVSMKGGSGADMSVLVENYANSKSAGLHSPHGLGTAGGITIGNVSLNLTKHLGTAQLVVSETGRAAGAVSVGNVSLSGHTGANLEATVYEYAGPGGVASGLTIGNVSIGGVGAKANLSVSESGAVVGMLKVGNVALTAPNLHMSITNHATAGAAGGVKVGNVTLIGNERTAGTKTNYIDQTATGGAGALSVGNVTISVGKGQELKLSVTNDGSAGGAVTIGNIALAIANTNATTKAADADFKADSDNTVKAGSLTTGNITVGSSGVTTKAALTKAFMTADVNLTATHGGSITVGNITVDGGVLTKAGAVDSDNFSTISDFLHFTTTGTITVGNVDYSGYFGLGDASTIIDVSGYAGAGSIIGSQNGSTIIDNKGVNAIDVSHTTQADIIELQDTQTGVTDSGTKITASQTALDSITGIHTGDAIELSGGTLTGTTITQSGANSFSGFLAAAETDLHSGGTDAAFTADVGGNTYVAMWDGGKVAEIVEVVGIHTFTVAANELHFAT